MKYEICEHIDQQTNIQTQQKIKAKTLLRKMKRRSRGKDCVPANKDELILFF